MRRARAGIAAAALMAAACASGGGGPAAVDATRARARPSVFHLSGADFDLLWEVAVEKLAPYGTSVAEKAAGRLESRDFYTVEAGIPEFGFVEIEIKPLPPDSGRFRLDVWAYRFDRRYADGTPFSDGGPPTYRFAGMNEPLQDELARSIYQTYLERAAGGASER